MTNSLPSEAFPTSTVPTNRAWRIGWTGSTHGLATLGWVPWTRMLASAAATNRTRGSPPGDPEADLRGAPERTAAIRSTAPSTTVNQRPRVSLTETTAYVPVSLVNWADSFDGSIGPDETNTRLPVASKTTVSGCPMKP